MAPNIPIQDEKSQFTGHSLICCYSRLLALWGLLVLGGCNNKGTNVTGPAVEAERPFQGQTIKVSVPTGLGFGDEWKNPLDDWSAQTGANFKLEEVAGWEDSKLSPTTMLPATLVLFPLNRLGDTLANGMWQPIPEGALGEKTLDWTEIFPGLRDNVCSPDRNPQLVALNVPVLVCYYREDLLKKAGLSPPQTWTEYHELLQRLPEWAPGLTAVEPWCPEFRSTLFLARAAAHAKHPGHFSFLFDIDSGEPLIDTPGFVRGLEQTRADLPLLSKDVLKMSPSDCRRELLAGRAALALTFETGPNSPPALFGPVCAEKSSAAKSPASTDKTKPSDAVDVTRPNGIQIAFAPLPGAAEAYNISVKSWERRSDQPINRASLTGFAGLMAAVSKSASPAERDAAWNALAKLSRSEGGPNFPAGTLSVSRQSHFESPRLFVGKTLTETEARKYINVIARCMQDSQLVLELPIPNREPYREALAGGLTDALDGKSSSAEVLKQVAEKWKTLNQTTGVEKVRDQYCRGIGLRAPGAK